MQPSLTRLIFDASALINIEDAGRLESLTPLATRVLIPVKVEEELRKVPRGGFRPGRFHRRMETWLNQRSFMPGRLLVHESRDYLRFRTLFGEGESAAIALALHRGGILIIDDGSAKAAAEKELVNCMLTAEFLAALDRGDFGLL